jgi:hypothetical protein
MTDEWDYKWWNKETESFEEPPDNEELLQN